MNDKFKRVCMACGREAKAVIIGPGWACSCGFAWGYAEGRMEYSWKTQYGWTINKVPDGCLFVEVERTR